MSVTQASRAFFARCFDYSGRSSRSEYWYAVLFLLLASAACTIVDAAIGWPVFSALFNLVTFLPNISLGVRRLHDTGHSGWWLLAPVVPAFTVAFVAVLAGTQAAALVGAVGALVGFGVIVTMLVWFCRAGTPGDNRYGPNPLGLQLPAI